MSSSRMKTYYHTVKSIDESPTAFSSKEERPALSPDLNLRGLGIISVKICDFPHCSLESFKARLKKQ